MRRHTRLAFPLLAVLAITIASFSLTAQPDGNQPSHQDNKFELTIPPGSYINYVFSLDMPPTSKPLRISIDGPQGFSSLLVPPGETVILPVATGDKPLKLMRALTVRLTHPASKVHGFGSTPTGPVPFKAE